MNPFWRLLVAETRVTIVGFTVSRVDSVRYQLYRAARRDDTKYHSSSLQPENKSFTCQSPAPSAPAASPPASERGGGGENGHDDRFSFGSLTD